MSERVLEIYSGEGKWFKFTITENKVLLDVSNAHNIVFQILLGITLKYEVIKANLDMTQASIGKIRANLPKSVSINMKGTYDCRLELELTNDTDVVYKKFRLKVK